MTVRELCSVAGFAPAVLPDTERNISGGYAGDLLSWVMGRAKSDCCWATIMTNINVIAVASLADVACVVICEGCKLDDSVIKAAESKMVNVVYTDMSVYEFCGKLSVLMNE